MTTLILDENFLDQDLVVNTTVSSEDASFLVENLFNAQRRSKVWRSEGLWEITSSNNVIVFRETTAVDLTATITAQDYNSDTTFLAAIKTALEASGASVYTITRDATTNKINIASDGAGGGNILELQWTDGASAGFAGISGFSTAANDTGALTYLADLLKIHTSEWVKFDFGISTNPEAFVMIGPRNAPIKITPGSTITLQANETDIWTSPTFSQVITYDESVMSLFKAAASVGLHTDPLRFWRLLIVDDDNPLGFVELGTLFLGDFFESTSGKVQFPLAASFIDRSATVFSEGGQTFSDIREKSESFTLNWFGFNVSDKEKIDLIFDSFGTSVPFFISLDPDLVYSSTISMLRYVKFERPVTWTLVTPKVFSAAMALREEL